MKRAHPSSSSEDSDNGRKTNWKHNKTKPKEPYSLRSRDRENSDRSLKWTFKDILSGNSTCWSERSKSQTRRGQGKKPSEVFRTDLITAMKVHDSYQLSPDDFYVLADSWRQDWEKGVQVPVSPQSIPQPVARVMTEKGKEIMFTKPKKLIRTSGSEALGYVDIRTLAEGMCRYDLSEQDVSWLELINQEFTELGLPSLGEITMEMVMEEFERRCHDGMSHAVETEEGLGIEYDEDVVCDVCQSPDGEDNNEMVFCDKCNICVHQACYGIQKVPKGSWLCRTCALGIVPTCQLCPKKGGAMKPTRSGTKWVHVSCALWIPEVSIRNPEKMEPITNVSQIPSNRWSLICCLCKEKSGACIQCSAKNCRTAFHVTCGLHCGLQMNTLLTEADEVKFKSYCPKHSGLEGDESVEKPSGEVEHQEKEEKDHGPRDKEGKRRGRVRETQGSTSSSTSSGPPRPLLTPPARTSSQPDSLSSRQQEEKRVNQRKLKLQALEEDFFQFVDAGEVAGHLKLSPDTVDFVYQYWKVKRRANFNQPLLTPKKDEEESLARREQEVLLRRLELFTHLRQDLERVRNLTYMVTRREKMKRSLCRVQEQTFQQQVRLLDHELLAGNDASKKAMEEMFSLSLVATQSSQSRSPWSHGGPRAKRGGAGKLLGRRKSLNLPQSHSEGNSMKTGHRNRSLTLSQNESLNLPQNQSLNLPQNQSLNLPQNESLIPPQSHSEGSSLEIGHRNESLNLPQSHSEGNGMERSSSSSSSTVLQGEHRDNVGLQKLSSVAVAGALSYTRIHNHGVNVRLHKLEISQLTNHTKLLLPERSKVTNNIKLNKPEISQVTSHIKLSKPVVNQVNNSIKRNKPEASQVTNHTKVNEPEINQLTNHTKLNKPVNNQVTNHSKLNKPEVSQVTNHTKLNKPDVSQVTNHTKLNKPEVSQVTNHTKLNKPVSHVTNHTKLNKPVVSQVTNHTKLNKSEVIQVTNHTKLNKSEVSQVTNHTKLNKPEVSQVTNHVKHNKQESRRGLKREASEPNHHDDSSYTMVLTRRRRGNGHNEEEEEKEEKEEEEEEEERRRKKKSAVAPGERSPFVSIRRLGSKVIEKQIGWLKGTRVTGADDSSTDRGTQNGHHQAPVPAPSKPNGCLRRAPSSSTSNGSVPNGRIGSHLRSWGKFRIPKRSVGGKDQEVSEPSDAAGPPRQHRAQQRCKTQHRQSPTNASTQPSYPRTRLRTGTESEGAPPPSDGELEHNPKKCHSRQLRGQASSIGRRYGAHIIRRGVLAS